VVPLDVHLSDEAISREPESEELWIRARDLVTQHVRQRADTDQIEAHLGQVTIE
jgi:hypothetical protein